MLRWCVRGGPIQVARALGPLLVGWSAGHWGVAGRRVSRPHGRGVSLWGSRHGLGGRDLRAVVIGTPACAACVPQCGVVCVCECMSKARRRWWSQLCRSRPRPRSRSDQDGAVPPPFVPSPMIPCEVLATPSPGVRAGVARCASFDEGSCSSAGVGRCRLRLCVCVSVLGCLRSLRAMARGVRLAVCTWGRS